MGRGDLTAARWAALVLLLPVSEKLGRPPKGTKRHLFDGFDETRIGAPWRNMPKRCGKPVAADGTCAHIVTGLQARADASGLITWDVSVDSIICHADQHCR